VRAQGKPPRPSKDGGDDDDAYVEALKKGGLDADVARKVLAKWQEVRKG
jgi:hypothetical protein